MAKAEAAQAEAARGAGRVPPAARRGAGRGGAHPGGRAAEGVRDRRRARGPRPPRTPSASSTTPSGRSRPSASRPRSRCGPRSARSPPSSRRASSARRWRTRPGSRGSSTASSTSSRRRSRRCAGRSLMRGASQASFEAVGAGFEPVLRGRWCRRGRARRRSCSRWSTRSTRSGVAAPRGLTDPARSGDDKAALVGGLLAGRADEACVGARPAWPGAAGRGGGR